MCNWNKGISLQHCYIKPSKYRVSSSLLHWQRSLKNSTLVSAATLCGGGTWRTLRICLPPREGWPSAAPASSTSLGTGRDVEDFCCRKPLAGFCRKAAMSSRVLVSQLILSQRSVWPNDTSCGRPGFVHCLSLLFSGCDFSILVGWVWRECCYALENTAIRFIQNNHDY